MILDGTFNGENCFLQIIGFTVELGNGRNFKGHFSLKSDSFMM
jgi:hypothetical protein